METYEVLIDAFDRIEQAVRHTMDGLDADGLAFRPDADANSIAWLVWHLTRVEDDHVSELAGIDQAYVADGWAEKLGVTANPTDTGYGHTSEQVGAVRPQQPDTLVAYLAAVTARTKEYLHTLDAAALDRIVDRSWDPPVTAGVRLVSVIADCLQHAGQAAYIRGVYERSR